MAAESAFAFGSASGESDESPPDLEIKRLQNALLRVKVDSVIVTRG
jgi:hypothetical protein